MKTYSYEVKEFGNYAELHKYIKTDNGTIEQPVQNFPSKDAAEEAGREWKSWKEGE
jgi:hypothetical protein